MPLTEEEKKNRQRDKIIAQMAELYELPVETFKARYMTTNRVENPVQCPHCNETFILKVSIYNNL
jgi:hypothetical protein